MTRASRIYVFFFVIDSTVLLYIGKGNNMEHEEKLDSVQLEYLYLLQSQLASQKIHFEGIIDRLEQQHRQEVNLIHFYFFYFFINSFFIYIYYLARGDKGKGEIYSKGK